MKINDFYARYCYFDFTVECNMTSQSLYDKYFIRLLVSTLIIIIILVSIIIVATKAHRITFSDSTSALNNMFLFIKSVFDSYLTI